MASRRIYHQSLLHNQDISDVKQPSIVVTRIAAILPVRDFLFISRETKDCEVYVLNVRKTKMLLGNIFLQLQLLWTFCTNTDHLSN